MEQTENRINTESEMLLNNLADVTERISPSLFMYFRIKGREVSSLRSGKEEELNQLKEMSICIYCGSPLKSGNFSIRLIPRLQPTQRISRLMKKYRENPSSLGRYQRKLVEDFKTSTNKMKVSCFVCKKFWKVTGQACLDRLKQRREFEDGVKLRQKEVKKAVIQDAETLNVKRAERKERKKELKKQKQQQKLDRDLNAGLKIVRLKKDQETDVNSSGKTFVQSNKPVSVQRDSNGKISSTKEDGKFNPKDLSRSKSKAKDDVKKMDSIQNLFEETRRKQEETKRKHQFSQSLKHMLAQKDSVSKKKEKTNKKKKSALQAFLTKI